MAVTSTKLDVLEAVVNGDLPRDAGKRFGVHPKRVAAWCEQWAVSYGYDWGVCIDLGWFYDEDKPKVREFIARQRKQLGKEPNNQ